MITKINRFVADFKMTDNNTSFNFDIPYNIDTTNGRFMLTGFSGKLSATTFVNIASDQLASPFIYNSINGSHNIIGTEVLTTTPTKPTNRTITDSDIGYPIPSGVGNQSCNLTIKLLNENGTLIADGDIDWVVVSITFWSD